MLELIGQQLVVRLNSAVRPTVWLIILVVIFVPLERAFAVHPQKILRKGFVTDLGYYFLSSLLPALLLGAPLGLLAWMVHQTVPRGIHTATAAWPLWARVFCGLVAGEIGYYWGHRWSHEIPFLWRFHSIHHSAEEVNFIVSSRAHPIDMVFGRICGTVPIYVLGLGGPEVLADNQVPVLVALIGIVWGFFIHANLRWRFGPLEWLISTPAFHHWHHTLNGPINRNYSSTLPWLDWIFGTHYLPRDAWPEAYGIEAEMPESLVEQLAYPMFMQPSASRQPADGILNPDIGSDAEYCRVALGGCPPRAPTDLGLPN
jgi:sterol desaturase/sphingolipid hydroxylase (fatty acid hydroxylase superfamily)